MSGLYGCYKQDPAIFSKLDTQCGPFRVTQLALDCPGNSYRIRSPGSVISKNGTFRCTGSILASGIQEIPFVHVSLFMVKNGRKQKSYVTMEVPSYIMTINGVLSAKSGRV